MRFYALTTKALSERMAADDLRRKGFDHVFAPLLVGYRKARAGKSRMIETVAPFFRGYVFVGLEADEGAAFSPYRWREAERVNGARAFVRFGERGPSPMPGGFVAAMLSAMDKRGLIHAPDWKAAADPIRARIEALQAVRVLITDGPFGGFEGEIEAATSEREALAKIAMLDTRQRVSILASIFGRITTVELERSQVELIGDCKPTMRVPTVALGHSRPAARPPGPIADQANGATAEGLGRAERADLPSASVQS